MKTKPRVAIFGCGPSGLLAAEGAERAGAIVTIFSKKVMSKMPGAIYIHEPIPTVTESDADAIVRFLKSGTKRGYAQKVYGEERAPCSWDEFPEGERPAWNIAKAYQRLWSRFQSYVIDQEINSRIVAEGKNSWDLVISTIPAPVICLHPELHEFKHADIWIRSRRLKRSTEPGTGRIIYNGKPTVPWYRYSNLFGWEAWEFGHQVQQAVHGRKPIETTCDCHPGIVRAGRFGKWQKGVLVNHAYKEAIDAVQSL